MEGIQKQEEDTACVLVSEVRQGLFGVARKPNSALYWMTRRSAQSERTRRFAILFGPLKK